MLLDDDERERHKRTRRELLTRMLLFPTCSRMDLYRRLRHGRMSKDSDVLFHMAFGQLMKTNDTPAGPPLQRYPKRSFEYTPDEMRSHIRFNHEEFRELMTVLGVPDRFRFLSWSFDGEEALLILLRRLSGVDTFKKLRSEFRREECELCTCFNGMIKWMVDTHGHLISGDLRRWRPVLRGWSRAVSQRSGDYDHGYYGYICMFIDGTCVRICRPTSGRTVFYDLQRLFYSGYKKYHNLNFCCIVAPNGLCIDLCGPVPGRHSDKWTQSWSSTEVRLRELFRGLDFTVYGDDIYNNSDVIKRKKRGLNLSAEDIRQISKLNGSRVSVENYFAKVYNDWPFISFKKNLKVLSCPCGVGNIYKVAVLLTNFKVCCQGSQVGGGIFGLSAPELSVYILGGVQSNCHLPPNINTL